MNYINAYADFIDNIKAGGITADLSIKEALAKAEKTCGCIEEFNGQNVLDILRNNWGQHKDGFMTDNPEYPPKLKSGGCPRCGRRMFRQNSECPHCSGMGFGRRRGCSQVDSSLDEDIDISEADINNEMKTIKNFIP